MMEATVLLAKSAMYGNTVIVSASLRKMPRRTISILSARTARERRKMPTDPSFHH